MAKSPRNPARWWPGLWLGLFLMAALAVPGAGRSSGHAMAQPVWRAISCSQSGLSTEPMQKCYKGPLDRGNSGNCHAENYATLTTTRQRRTLAVAIISDTSGTPDCYLLGDRDFHATFPKSMSILKDASGWSALTRVGDTPGMYFDFPNRHCFAFDLKGRRWGHGYASHVDGFVCGALGGAAVRSSEITQFIASVHLRQP